MADAKAMTTTTLTTANAPPSTSFAPFLIQQSQAILNARWHRSMPLKTLPGERQREFERCRADPVYWIKMWVDTYDPRFIGDGCPARIPFNLFPKQEAFIRWLQWLESQQKDGACEKSREAGVTWLCAAYCVHGWLFREGFRAGIGSRKLELVDKIGDPKSIFEKIRFILRNLPKWMLPPGFSWTRHDNYCRLINPVNDASISGEGGDEIGRGDRTTIYFVDESASLEHPELADAALSQTTRCRIDVSTAKGTHLPFYKRLRRLPPEQTFKILWQDDPRKSQAWYDAECLRIGDPRIVAQELDCDHAAAAVGIEWPIEYFSPEIFFDEWPGDIHTRVMALDPSKGSRDKSGDYSAWTMLGVDRDNGIWIDADLDNVRPIEPLTSDAGQRSIVSDGFRLFNEFKPTAVLIETNNFQEMVAHAFIRYGRERGVSLPVYAVNHTIPKVQRIRELSPFLAQKRFRVRNTPGGRMLVQQMREFPECEHDDAPDCAATGVEMLNHLMFGNSGGNRVEALRA